MMTTDQRSSWMLVLACLAGCVPPGGGPVAPPAPGEQRQSAAKPSATPASAEPPRVGVIPGPIASAGAEVPVPAVRAAGIIGKLKLPEGLVGKSDFGLLALAQAGVAGASVTLVDAAGELVSNEAATTAADGGFRFERLPAADAPFFVRAKFKAKGLPLELTAPAEPPDGAGDLTLDVDPASTLVAARFRRLLADGSLPAKPGVLLKLRALEAAVREALGDADALPALGEDAADLVAAFDQIALDTPAVAELAAKLAARAAERDAEWTVSTVLDGATLAAAGADAGADAEAAEGIGGVFALDGQGRMHVATTGSPVRILRLDDAGKATEVAKLPADLVAPASLAFGPDGALTAAAGNGGRGTWICRGTSGELPKIAGGPFFRANVASGLGRIAVDDKGTVFAAAPKAHVILAIKPGQELPRIVAGGLGQPGHQDGFGDAARFRQPVSLAFAPDGALWVADMNNACIRRLSWPLPAAQADVSTHVGRPGEAFYRNGRGAFARIGRPTSVAAGPDGTLYLTDAGSARVRRVSPQGSVFLVAGAGQPGVADGPGPLARFSRPGHVAIAPDGALWVHDLDAEGAGEASAKIRRIAPGMR